MKTIIIILLCAFAAKAQNAKIYFIRANEIQTGLKSFGNLTNSYMYVDKKKKCGLIRNGMFASFEIQPGEHIFQTSFGKADPFGQVKVNVAEGKNYYFAFVTSQLWELTESTGERIVASIEEGNCNDTEKD